jgi:hypothetical protein
MPDANASCRRHKEPETVAQIPIDHFDGLDTLDDLSCDGGCVADVSFQTTTDRGDQTRSRWWRGLVAAIRLP